MKKLTSSGGVVYFNNSILLLKKINGDWVLPKGGVEQGETLFRIHSTNPTDFAFANGVVEGYSGYEISPRSHY